MACSCYVSKVMQPNNYTMTKHYLREWMLLEEEACTTAKSKQSNAAKKKDRAGKPMERWGGITLFIKRLGERQGTFFKDGVSG